MDVRCGSIIPETKENYVLLKRYEFITTIL